MSEDRPFCRSVLGKGLLLFLERKKSLRSAGPSPHLEACVNPCANASRLGQKPPPQAPFFEEMIPELGRCYSLFSVSWAIKQKDVFGWGDTQLSAHLLFTLETVQQNSNQCWVSHIGPHKIQCTVNEPCPVTLCRPLFFSASLWPCWTVKWDRLVPSFNSCQHLLITARTVLIKRGTDLPSIIGWHSHMTQLAERNTESWSHLPEASLNGTAESNRRMWWHCIC